MPRQVLPCSNCGRATNRYPSKTGQAYCNTECKAQWQRKAKPVTKEWLEQKYIVEGLTMPEIARMVNRDPTRVDDWMKAFGIPTRHRGSYGLHQFNN